MQKHIKPFRTSQISFVEKGRWTHIRTPRTHEHLKGTKAEYDIFLNVFQSCQTEKPMNFLKLRHSFCSAHKYVINIFSEGEVIIKRERK